MAIASSQVISGDLTAGDNSFQKEVIGLFDKWNKKNIVPNVDNEYSLARIL
jgi:hypothetical protein